MEGNMVEENGNSSLDPLGGESASGHNNSDEQSSQQQQQSQMNTSSLHHPQNASPSSATVLATSANLVQFIPTQSVQVRHSSFHKKTLFHLENAIPYYYIIHSYK